jgi:hypothetical protein
MSIRTLRLTTLIIIVTVTFIFSLTYDIVLRKNLNDKLKLDLYHYVKHEVMQNHKRIKVQSKEPPK